MKPSRKQAAQTGSPEKLWQMLQLVSEVAEILRTGPPGEKTLAAAVKAVGTAVPFDGATLYLIDRAENRLKRAAGIGSPVELLSFLSMDRGEGLSGWTANNKKPILLSERSTVSSFDPSGEYGTFASIPLLAVDDVIGVLNIGCFEPKAIDETEVTLLSVVTTQMALCIERLGCMRELESAEEALAQARAEGNPSAESLSAARELQEAVKVLEGVSNDINNSLSVIVGNIQCLILEKTGINQKAISRLRRMESAAIEIGRINRKLREIATGANDRWLAEQESAVK